MPLRKSPSGKIKYVVNTVTDDLLGISAFCFLPSCRPHSRLPAWIKALRETVCWPIKSSPKTHTIVNTTRLQRDTWLTAAPPHVLFSVKSAASPACFIISSVLLCHYLVMGGNKGRLSAVYFSGSAGGISLCMKERIWQRKMKKKSYIQCRWILWTRAGCNGLRLEVIRTRVQLWFSSLNSLHYHSSVAHHTTSANSVQKTIFTLKILFTPADATWRWEPHLLERRNAFTLCHIAIAMFLLHGLPRHVQPSSWNSLCFTVCQSAHRKGQILTTFQIFLDAYWPIFHQSEIRARVHHSTPLFPQNDSISLQLLFEKRNVKIQKSIRAHAIS